MKVRERPRLQVCHSVGEIDAVDLKALSLIRAWGASTNGHKERGWTFSPCPRPDCGGAIVSGWGAGACILCARSGEVLVVATKGRNGYGPRWGKEKL